MENRWIGGTLLLALLLSLGIFHYGEMKALQRADWDPKMMVLLEKLNESEVSKREEALKILSREKDGRRVALPLLIRLLKDPVPSVRAEAARVLGQWGSKRTSAIRGLTERMLEDSDSEVRRQASEALSRMGEAALPAFVKALKHENWDRRIQGARFLGKLGPQGASAVSDLVEALMDKRMEVRREAIKALGEIGPEGASSFPSLTRASKDKDPKIRKLAQEALEKVMAREGSFVEAYLKKNTRQGLSQEKRLILLDLEGLKQRGDRVLSFLYRGLEGPEDKNHSLSQAYIQCYRVIAAVSLLKMGKENPEIWKILSAPLPSSSVSRRAVIKAHFLVAPGNKTLMEPLVQQLKFPETREVVAFHLKVIKEALPYLTEILQDGKKGDLHLEIAKVLQKMGDGSAPALPVVIQLLNSPDWKGQKRIALLQILENLQEKAAPAISALLPLVKNPPFRDRVLEIFGNVGPQAKEVIPSLIKLANSDKKALPKVLETLRKIDGPSADALLVKAKPPKAPVDPALDNSPLDKNRIPSLILGLRSKNDSRREQAVRLLLEKGPLASPAVPDLLKAAKEDTYWRVRVLSIQTLGKIGFPGAPALPLLMDLTKTSTFKPIQEASIIAMGEIAGTLDGASDLFSKGAETLKWLMEHHESPVARDLAKKALLKLSPQLRQMKVKQEVLHWMGRLKRGTEKEKEKALVELGKIGPPAAPAVSLLTKELASISWSVQRKAIQALGSIGPSAAPAVPLLIKKVKYWQVQMEVIETLGQIGPGAASAIRSLEGLLDARKSKTREAVRAALKKIKRNF